MLKVLFLIEGWISPAPRYRVLQYLPHLAAEGITFKVRALHGDRYPSFYHTPVLGKLYKMFVRPLRRFHHLRDAQDFDLVFQQRNSLPFSPALEKILAKKNPKLIFDFDDAIYRTETGESQTRMDTFQQIVARARAVIAGSAYLAGFSGEGTHVIPTVIDTVQYLPVEKSPGETLTIGWMGTHSNYPNFLPLLDTLREFLGNNPHIELRLIGDRPPPFELPNMVFSQWHKDMEIHDLQSFDIGLMPLADSEWNRGKCAFKLIQYMAVGIPVIAGRVGANQEVVLEGETGLLANTPDEWMTALKTLAADAKLRQRLGAAGRERCVQYYSLESQKEPFMAVLREVAGDSDS